ncbi:MAG: alpha-2-macroglobulin family protein [Rhizobiaceae bacterium]
MTTSAVRGLGAAIFLIFGLLASAHAQSRQVITTSDADYFGFDLRTEQNVSLDQCSTTCLRDEGCRAFTYNTKAKWCFLKSDFAKLNPFPGAVAGKVVPLSGDPDIGAPPALAFFPDWMAEEARQYRTTFTDGSIAVGEVGLAALVEAADRASLAGDPRTAVLNLKSAVAILPDDHALWIRLSRALNNVPPLNSQEAALITGEVSSTAYNGYLLTRTAAGRADALAALAVALDRRDMFRPALSAYEASLALVNSAEVRAAYEDLKARKGFRIVEHSVDSDATSPRICAQFSEGLVKAGVNYADFVTVDGAAPKAVEAKDRQICVEGLEHGKSYSVTFRAGLPAAVGEVIEYPVVLNVYVRDRTPSLRFTGDSFVLPSAGRRGIPVVSVNMDAADVKLYRIGDRSLAQLLSGYQFLRQLDGYDLTNIADQMGAPVWQGQVEIANELNSEVTTSFPIDEALPARKPGVYVLTAQPIDDRRDSWESRATQWFVVSDIGLTTYTGQDGLTVFARSLATAKPIAGTALTLLARNNEVLGTATTDAEGRATFTPGLTRGVGGLAPAVLTAEAADQDFVFLDMTRAGFDLSDRGVDGRAVSGALDVYAWTERGIYRAGETVHVAALARDDKAVAVENLPLTFIFTRPDGVEDRRLMSDGRAVGGHAVELPLTPTAMRGTWQVRLHTDPKEPAVATMMFLVEDFVPDRIEFDLTADRAEIALNETANVTLDGRYLYGAPAAGLALEGEINLATTREWARFPRYRFGLADEDGSTTSRIPLENLPAVGEDGIAVIPVTISQLPSTTRLIKADVVVRMREGGGRAVERRIDIGVRPEGSLIGIRPDFDEEAVPEGANVRFGVISVGPDGSREAAGGLLWKLVKVERQYQWYRSGNYWNYEPITVTSAVANGTVDTLAEAEATIQASVDWGRYRLEIESTDPAGPASSVEFNAGWYVDSSSTETPDGLEIALDKETYAIGDVARLQVSPRFAGELLVTVGADRLLSTFMATVPEGGATVDIPVTADWGAGAYVTATLFRPGEGQETRMPARAIGVKWLSVDPAERLLSIRLDTEQKTEPRQALEIPVTVTGAAPLSEAYVMVAAVDVGILNLTNYKAPDPVGWYYGQRRLGLEIRDLYGRLIDGSLGTTGRLRTGGDGAMMSTQGNAPKERLVAFFSGPVRLDAAGKATIAFDIPQFNGTVRVMAVAWTKDAVGQASSDVIVRDPVVVTAGIPRFMAPGDSALMRLDIANTDGPAGDYAFSVEATPTLSTGSAALPEKVTLGIGGRDTIFVPLVAQSVGDATVTVRLAHADGTTAEQVLFLPVRPATAPVTQRTLVKLSPGGGKLTVDSGLLAASLVEGATVAIGVAPTAAFDVPAMLMSLSRYPYGCTEQTTSRALPLLYLSELSEGYGLPDDPDVAGRVQDAIYRVVDNQSSYGAFGLWSPGSGDLWLDAYVTDFLTRAREKGYVVPAEAMRAAVENLGNSLAYDLDLEERGSEIAYALYVLARNGKASIGDLRYYSDTQLEAFSSPMAVAHLAASLSLYGDAARSERTFAAALALAEGDQEVDYYRYDYGSRLRDGAAMLSLAAESTPRPSIVPALIQHVVSERAKHKWTSTQDEAWMLLAARALAKGNEGVRLEINGTPHSGLYSARFTGDEIAVSPVEIVNPGPDPMEVSVTTIASPIQPPPAGGNGFAIERAYYHMDGSEANVSSVSQNERYVVVLKVSKHNDWQARVVVSDLLPAGFEIDNPRLMSSAELSNFGWLQRTEVAHTEFRDDRFIAAFDQGGSGNLTLAYVVRAVTPGVFSHPAATVEDMYRPEFSARTAAGIMEVTAP